MISSDEKRYLFLSSSSDMKAARERVATALSDWMRQHELDIASYEWDVETDQGRMLKDRMPIQSQLPDPYETFGKVPFTICLFGERCGVPLTPKIPKDWSDRLSLWLATEDEPGLHHPWPEVEHEQDRLLRGGSFPLTGTIFELISAFEASPDADNLILGYIADEQVTSRTSIEHYFNHNRERKRLTEHARNEREARSILEENYYPQVQALINLLRAYERISGTPAPVFSTQNDLIERVIDDAKRKLRRHFGIISLGNPFKNTLEHWTVDDPRSLPGRTGMVDEIERALDRNGQRTKPGLVLIKGTSGCGKSSILNRGVLGRMADRGHHVLAFRPTDFSFGEPDSVDTLWRWICDVIPAANMRTPSSRQRLDQYSMRLQSVLEEQSRHLVIGIDQFEEILDELNQFKAKTHRKKRFWLLLDFLARLARCRRVHLVATLETARWDTFCALSIEEVMGTQRLTFEADVSADQVARIAKAGFDSARIELDDPLVEEIKSQFEILRKQTAASGASASSLPLIGLGLARLFENFEHLATHGAKVGVQSDFSRSSDMALLTLDHVKETNSLNFEGMISDLAEEAWAAAGLRRIENWSIEDQPRRCFHLSTFLSPLVALDDDGHIQLQVVPDEVSSLTQKNLLFEFSNRRLLVPADRTEKSGARLRLAHQAIIDHWNPAKEWLAWEMAYLEIERELRRKANSWKMSGGSSQNASDRLLQGAAQVLYRYRGVDVLSNKDLQEDHLLLEYALYLFEQAHDPFEKVMNIIDDRDFSDVASLYQNIGLLQHFAASSPEFLSASGEKVRGLLNRCAWQDGPCIPWILDNFGDDWKSIEMWHPIVGAMQSGSRRNFDILFETIDNFAEPVGPAEFTLFGQAARYGNAYHIKKILSKTDDYEAVDKDGNTAAMWATMADNLGTFEEVLPYCDIERLTTNKLKRSVAHIASAMGKNDILRCLFNSPDLEPARLARVLAQQDGFGRTPLQLAVRFAPHSTVELLLAECDPRDAVHRGKSGETLFHAAVASFPQSQSDRVRARRVVAVLIGDGRLPVDMTDNNDRTAFETALRYPEARRLLRRHTKIQYADMTDALRKADLQSTTLSDALTLIGSNPNALTDLHEGERGIDILISGKKTYVLTKLVSDRLIDDELLAQVAGDLVELAGSKTTEGLRKALLSRFSKSDVVHLSALLNAALQHGEESNAAAARALGVRQVKGLGPLRSSIFHQWATQARQDRFEEAASVGRLALPVDAWGRKPSDCAADHNRVLFSQLEERLFDPSVEEELSHERPKKFHEFAKEGDVKAFERQARGANRNLPLDQDGKRPSEVAPSDLRQKFSELEETYFQKVN